MLLKWESEGSGLITAPLHLLSVTAWQQELDLFSWKIGSPNWGLINHLNKLLWATFFFSSHDDWASFWKLFFLAKYYEIWNVPFEEDGLWYRHQVSDSICEVFVICAVILWKVNSKTPHKTVLENSCFPTADHISGNMEDSLLEQLLSPVISDFNQIVCTDWRPCPISLLLGKSSKFATWEEFIGRHLKLDWA